MQAKAILRTLVAFVSKGVSVIDLYAVRGREFGLVDDGFFATLPAGGSHLRRAG